MRTKNHPFKLSVTGIDGSGKDTITRRSLEGISEDHGLSVVKLGRPAYVINNGESSQIFQHTTEAIDWLHGACDRLHNPSLITAANALNMVVQTRVMERSIDRHDEFDIVASSRDPRIDPAVYLDFYGGKSADHIADDARLRFMQRLTAVSRNLIILLQVDPELAIERIEQRIANEAAGDPSMRPKWRHIHENPTDLARLAQGYERVIAQMHPEDRAAIVRVDTNDKTQEDVVTEVQAAIWEAYSTDKQRLAA